MMKELTAIIDTNVLVSILKGSRGLSSIYTAFKTNNFKLVVSDEILKELAAVLYRSHLKIDHRDIKELFRLIKMKALRVKSRPSSIDVCRDPKDNFILELACQTKADFIVTGDEDLLVLKSFRDTLIIPPQEFIRRLE